MSGPPSKRSNAPVPRNPLLQPDPTIGGALDVDDILEVLDCEVENLRIKAMTSGIKSRDDLEPCLRVLNDLKVMGADLKAFRVQSAQKYVNECVLQMVAEREIFDALKSGELSKLKEASEKALRMDLRTEEAALVVKMAAEKEQEVRKQIKKKKRDERRKSFGLSMFRSKKPSVEDDDESEPDELLLKDRATEDKRDMHSRRPELRDAVLSAMRRCRQVMDQQMANGGVQSPGALFSAARVSDLIDMIKGDMNAVHVFAGEYHGVVRRVKRSAGSDVRVLGELGTPEEGMSTIYAVTDEGAKEALRATAEELGRCRQELVKLRESNRTLLSKVLAHAQEADSSAPSSPVKSVAETSEFATSPEPTNEPTLELSMPLDLSAFKTMRRVGVPDEAVRAKMELRGVDPKELFGDDEALDEAPVDNKSSNTRPSLKDDPVYGKFFKMLDMGVPKGAVCAKMSQDPRVVSTDVLDCDRNAPLPPKFEEASARDVDKPSNFKSKKKLDEFRWKRLHWSKIPTFKTESRAVVWDKVDCEFSLMEGELMELQKKFRTEVDQKKLEKKLMKQESALSVANAKPKLLESAKANNLSIVLARFAQTLNFKLLREMICALELYPRRIGAIGSTNDAVEDWESSEASQELSSEGYDAEDARAVLSFMPTPQETEAILNYKGSSHHLNIAESHMSKLITIPRYKSRVRVFLFKLKYDEIREDVLFDVERVETACFVLRDSHVFPKLLEIVLKIGNVLNQNSRASNDASSFELSALNKLKSVTGFNEHKKTTALHVLAEIVTQRRREILDFLVSDKMEEIRSAANAPLSHVKTRLKSLAFGVKDMENEFNHMTSIKNGHDFSAEDDKFFKALEKFYDNAKREVVELGVRVHEVDRLYTELALYLCENPNETPSEELFKRLVVFTDDFLKAHGDNQRANQAKRSKRSASPRK